jgi:hypothetical protein
MKNKLTKIMGIGFVFVLVASMMLFAIPAAADPYDEPVPFPSNLARILAHVRSHGHVVLLPRY